MPLTELEVNSSDMGCVETLQGPNIWPAGAMYTQYAALTQLTNSNAETSLFAGETLGTNIFSGAVQGARSWPISTRIIPGAALNTYTVWAGEFWGTIQQTSNPTLRMRLFVTSSTGTATAIYDNAALTMTAAAAGSYFALKFRFWTTAFGASGSTRAICGYEYGSTAAGSAVTTVHGAPQAVTGIDLTQQSYTVDARATFSAASSSNNIQLLGGWFGPIA